MRQFRIKAVDLLSGAAFVYGALAKSNVTGVIRIRLEARRQSDCLITFDFDGPLADEGYGQLLDWTGEIPPAEN